MGCGGGGTCKNLFFFFCHIQSCLLYRAYTRWMLNAWMLIFSTFHIYARLDCIVSLLFILHILHRALLSPFRLNFSSLFSCPPVFCRVFFYHVRASIRTFSLRMYRTQHEIFIFFNSLDCTEAIIINVIHFPLFSTFFLNSKLLCVLWSIYRFLYALERFPLSSDTMKAMTGFANKWNTKFLYPELISAEKMLSLVLAQQHITTMAGWA